MRVRSHFVFSFTLATLLILSAAAADSGTEATDSLERLLNPTNLDASPAAARSYRVTSVSPSILTGSGLAASNSEEALRLYLMARGLDLSEASPTKLFYNDRTGVLTVRGTLRDLDAIETALGELAITPPQVTLRATIAEFVGADIDDEIKRLLRLEDLPAAPDQFAVTVLTESQTRTVIRALEQKPSVDLVTTSPITTLSGRLARLALAEPSYTVTDPPFTAPGKSPKARWSTKE